MQRGQRSQTNTPGSSTILAARRRHRHNRPGSDQRLVGAQALADAHDPLPVVGEHDDAPCGARLQVLLLIRGQGEEQRVLNCLRLAACARRAPGKQPPLSDHLPALRPLPLPGQRLTEKWARSVSTSAASLGVEAPVRTTPSSVWRNCGRREEGTEQRRGGQNARVHPQLTRSRQWRQEGAAQHRTGGLASGRGGARGRRRCCAASRACSCRRTCCSGRPGPVGGRGGTRTSQQTRRH